MKFSIKKLFVDVFAPQRGDILTIMVDMPHSEIHDTQEWQERRSMAEEWHREIERLSRKYNFKVNPVVTYDATGVHNSELPEFGLCEGNRIRLEDTAGNSTIIISMTQFSASAPLICTTQKYENLRVASMPLVSKAMQETGLAADTNQIARTCARTCARLASLFDQADGIEVLFSTGDTCFFDKSDHKPAVQDNGRLPPSTDKNAVRLRNLPSGEVFICPNESPDSETNGRIPVSYGDEIAVFVVKNNQVINVIGDGPMAARMHRRFINEKALRNIAEVAIGCNDRAVVTGNMLEDEKAGFHWAYGRSEHLGGIVGPKDFSAPDKVCHQDIVYAKGNPIVCTRLDFILPDGKRKTVIRDGVLQI